MHNENFKSQAQNTKSKFKIIKTEILKTEHKNSKIETEKS